MIQETEPEEKSEARKHELRSVATRTAPEYVMKHEKKKWGEGCKRFVAVSCFLCVLCLPASVWLRPCLCTLSQQMCTFVVSPASRNQGCHMMEGDKLHIISKAEVPEALSQAWRVIAVKAGSRATLGEKRKSGFRVFTQQRCSRGH